MIERTACSHRGCDGFEPWHTHPATSVPKALFMTVRRASSRIAETTTAQGWNNVATSTVQEKGLVSDTIPKRTPIE